MQVEEISLQSKKNLIKNKQVWVLLNIYLKIYMSVFDKLILAVHFKFWKVIFFKFKFI